MNFTRPSKSICLVRIFVLLLIIATIPRVDAWVFSEPLESMVKRAEIIFCGTLIKNSSYLERRLEYPFPSHPEEAAELELLFTDYEFRVDSILKGEYEEQTIRVTQLGGVNGRDRESYSTSYFLKLGEQYLILVLRSNEDADKWVTASGAQGVLKVVKADDETLLEGIAGGKDNAENKIELALQDFIFLIERLDKKSRNISGCSKDSRRP